jgi:hypothetical protein
MANDSGFASSYLNRSGTIIVFSAIVALAVGALFLKSDDVAHVPIRIGVCAFDSARVAPAFEALADFCRERGCGDIRWTYVEENSAAAGCNFYLMTSLQLSPALSSGSLTCALIAAGSDGRRYSTGAVIVRSGAHRLPPSGARVIFSSPVSAAGFLSPYRALAEAGCDVAAPGYMVDFAGRSTDDERVVFGVLYGAYDAGGISEERLRSLAAVGVVRRGEIDVLIEGQSLPEIVLAADPTSDTAARKGFVRKFPGVYKTIPRPLREELTALGMAAFLDPRRNDLDLIRQLSTMVPPRFAPRPTRGRGFSAMNGTPLVRGKRLTLVESIGILRGIQPILVDGHGRREQRKHRGNAQALAAAHRVGGSDLRRILDSSADE